MLILSYILWAGLGFGFTDLLLRSLQRPDLPVSQHCRLITAVLAAGLVSMLFHQLGPTVMFVRCAGLVPFLTTAAVIDQKHGLIPNRLILFGSGSGLLIGSFSSYFPGGHLIVMLTTMGVLCLIRVGSQWLWNHPGLGMGDVKLAGLMGLFLGWPVFWIFYLATVLGAIIGLAGLISGRLNRRSALPFAPMMGGAAILHWFLIPPEVVLPL